MNETRRTTLGSPHPDCEFCKGRKLRQAKRAKAWRDKLVRAGLTTRGAKPKRMGWRK